jgi:hypothetical protein
MVVIERVVARAFPKDERARHDIMEAAKERIAKHLEGGHSFARATFIEPVQDRHRSGSDKDDARQFRNGEHVRIQERER